MTGVRQCDYCGDVLVVPAMIQETAQVPVKVAITEGVLLGRYEFCGVNCLAFWVEDKVNRD